MNLRTVLHIIGNLLMVYAGTMLVPVLVSWAYFDHNPEKNEPFAFATGASVTFIVGLLMRLAFRADMKGFGSREGFAVVAIGWSLFALLGAIPWTLLGIDDHGTPLALGYLDAVFETMSGLTTTGATILKDIELYGHGILFWRSMTQWLGGMGIVVLVVAILPGLGAGGYQLLRAEVPGPTADKIAPRIAQTAKILWFVYLLLTVTQILLLWGPSCFASPEARASGEVMDLYDATCHAFSTIATGGFSTRNASMGAWGGWYQYVVIVFMILAGMNFLLHWHLLMGRPMHMLRNSEWRTYLSVVVVGTLLVFLCLTFLPVHPSELHGDDRASTAAESPPDALDPDFQPSPEQYESIESRFRHSLFQAVALITGTGYCTADWDRWPDICRFLLVCFMFIGGCAGSTCGALKLIRIMVVVKHAIREVRQLLFPNAVVQVRIQGKRVDDRVISAIIGTFTLYLFLLLIGMAVFALLPGFNLSTAFSCSASCIGNIGPGLGAIGATQHYDWIPDIGKLVCCVLMLLGRLEILTVFVLFLPSMYRR